MGIENIFYTIINASPGVMAGGYLSLFNSIWNDAERTEDVLPNEATGFKLIRKRQSSGRHVPPKKEKGSGRSRVPTPICNVCGTF